MRKLVIPALLGGLLLTLVLLRPNFSNKVRTSAKSDAGKSTRRLLPSQVRTPDLRLVLPPPLRRKAVVALRHPFVLPLKQREVYYQKQFAKARKVKVGVYEKLFQRVLERERMYEAARKGFSQQALRLAAVRYLRYRSLPLYRLYGYKVLQEFETHLDKYLAKGGAPLGSPTDDDLVLYPIAQKMKRLAGFYPMLLGQIGLSEARKGQRLTSEQRYWLRTMMMARWARQVWGFRPLEYLMGREVYSDYLRARIVWTRKENKRILAYRELLRLNPKFPKFRVLGWLLLSMNKKDKARVMLKKALKQNPQDSLSQRLLKQLQP
jgi:predicted Zn-dependent protease